MPDADAQVFGRGIGGIGLGNRERDDDFVRIVAHARDDDAADLRRIRIIAVFHGIVCIEDKRRLAVLHGHGGFDRLARIDVRACNAAHHVLCERLCLHIHGDAAARLSVIGGGHLIIQRVFACIRHLRHSAVIRYAI